MSRGNQREKAREKNLKQQASAVCTQTNLDLTHGFDVLTAE
jgi:hypothetical protein